MARKTGGKSAGARQKNGKEESEEATAKEVRCPTKEKGERQAKSWRTRGGVRGGGRRQVTQENHRFAASGAKGR